MAHIDDIIERRRRHRHYDEPLWDFVGRFDIRPLEHVTDVGLQVRLDEIERNIQFLDVGPSGRDALPPERGWLSPWWWLRLRYWTLTEMRFRSLARKPSIALEPVPILRPEFHGVVAGGRQLLVRISRVQYLLDMIEKGRLRFAPAHIYKELEEGGRADDEMSKGYHRPGRAITITGPMGVKIDALGNVTFTTNRAVGEDIRPVPYWLTSYSSDLDPRLLKEFPSGFNDDAIVVIFEPLDFVTRACPVLNRMAPRTIKSLFPIDYYDTFHPPAAHLSPLKMKQMRFACQREMRMVLDPGDRQPLGDGGDFFVDIGSIADIAAVYAPDGKRMCGTGPDSFLY